MFAGTLSLLLGLSCWVALLVFPASNVRQTYVRQTLVCRSSVLTQATATTRASDPQRQTEVCRTIESSYDSVKDRTTVRLAPVKISGPRVKYHSLHFRASYSYPGRIAQQPVEIDFELRSVVKARKLKIDLYVVFVVDGEKIFLSSSRSAIRNPVPGKRWIGERLVFNMPYDTLIKLAEASAVEIRMDAVSFELGETQLEALRDFAERTRAK